MHAFLAPPQPTVLAIHFKAIHPPASKQQSLLTSAHPTSGTPLKMQKLCTLSVPKRLRTFSYAWNDAVGAYPSPPGVINFILPFSSSARERAGVLFYISLWE
ncbi:hypothetical protein CDAR_18991 [Caerostris darwini]|uniref:Uncharacterized protein n=1 Tax=Caerostris darwini TaxID=1538125 RepID=A0AAV4WBT8_9ARAC|nr:hypothetical protein CDAR_18991 [Caerostris darwini]